MATGPKLLFVDEGAAWLCALREQLRTDHEVIAVETGPEALQALETIPVSVLITDTHLTSVQDRRFGQSLQRLHATLPRILLCDRPDIEFALTHRNGFRADVALPKPCSHELLKSWVVKLVGASTMRAPVTETLSETIDESAGAGNMNHSGVAARNETVSRETLPDPFEAASGDD